MRAATLFNYLIEATLMGSVMILIMLAVRALLHRQLGRRALCAAWMLIAIRLLVPISLPNPLMNDLRPAFSNDPGVRPIADQVRVRATDALYNAANFITDHALLGDRSFAVSQRINHFGYETSYGHTARWILLGYACIAAAVAIVFVLRRKKDAGSTGWYLLRAACCSIHWFNPLVWIAAHISRADQTDRRKEAPVRWLRCAALCVAIAGTVLSFGTSECLPPLPMPEAPVLQGDGVTPRAIATGQEAVAYAQEILSSAPYLPSPSLLPYDSFGMLTWEPLYIEQEKIWQVRTMPVRDLGGGVFELVFDAEGRLWSVTDETLSPWDGNYRSANPSYRTAVRERAPLYAYVDSYATFVLPQDAAADPVIHSDYWVEGRRYISISTECGVFVLAMDGSIPYVCSFTRHGYLDIFNAIHEARYAAQEKEQQAAAQAAEETEMAFSALADIPGGTPLASAAATAHSYLTEVYGYSVADADAFLFGLQQKDGETWCVYFHPNAPQWKYAYQLGNEHGTAVTPYSQPHHPAPEGPFRSFWYAVADTLSLSTWADGDRGAFLTLAQDGLYDIALSQEVQQAIRSGEMPAAQAVTAAFEAHYGEQALWTDAMGDWHAAVLALFSLH